ncbi:MAG TPA: cadherin-like domain-containing protein, partial [Chthoniobacteraceae bacterium]|nr:cadherin-like domain-containing protein [Chthoniobacteraceae bacterium]
MPTVHANVIANDTDPNIDPVKIVRVTDGAHGTVTFTPQGRVTYLPGPDYDGGAIQSDTFTYTIVDPLGGTSTATVTVSVPDNIFHAGAGGYRGLVTSGGLIKGRLNLALTKQGTFSGSIFLDAVKTPVKGTLAADGTFTGTVSRPDP